MKEITISVVMILILLAVCVILLQGIHRHNQQFHAEQIALQKFIEDKSQYPDIPQCDKELWDRIREGCD